MWEFVKEAPLSSLPFRRIERLDSFFSANDRQKIAFIRRSILTRTRL